MFLAAPACRPGGRSSYGTLGIGLAASSAAAINHVLDRRFDEKMARTRNRPHSDRSCHDVARRSLYAAVLGVVSMLVLWLLVNPLTAVLTFCSLIGYAVLYTVWLKHVTPQNIVIGGAAGAAPPVLGWTAVTGHGRSLRAAAVPDHLRVDAATLLGARDRAPRRLCARPAFRCCRSPMASISRDCTSCSTRSCW